MFQNEAVGIDEIGLSLFEGIKVDYIMLPRRRAVSNSQITFVPLSSERKEGNSWKTSPKSLMKV